MIFILLIFLLSILFMSFTIKIRDKRSVVHVADHINVNKGMAGSTELATVADGMEAPLHTTF